jgi:hypothetical protein
LTAEITRHEDNQAGAFNERLDMLAAAVYEFAEQHGMP